MTTRRLARALVLGWACCTVPSAAPGELAPRSGTFIGYYHRDSLGVGHFRYFYVVPELHQKLAKHEGKLIRLVVPENGIVQRINPGPAIILEVGKVEELPQPPLEWTIRTRPDPVFAGEPFELLVQITDRRKGGEFNSHGIALEGMTVHIRQPGEKFSGEPDEPSWLFPPYTNRQLAIDAKGGQIGVDAWPFLAGRPNLGSETARVELRPADSWTWMVAFPKGIARADAEVQVRTGYAVDGRVLGKDGRTLMPVEAWQRVPVRAASPPADKLLRLGEAKLTFNEQDHWTDLRLKILPAKGKKVRVPAAVDHDNAVFPGTFAGIAHLEALETDGTPIDLEARRTPEQSLPYSARARMVDLPEGGAIITARFRKASRFTGKISRLRGIFVTEQGTDTLTLSEDYSDPDVQPEIPFGPVTDGVKLRIRPARSVFKAGESIIFHAEAVNVSGKPICWWTPSRGYGTNMVVEIGGKILDLPPEKAEYIGGWAATWTVRRPQGWTVTLPDTIRPAKGPHTLRYRIVSKGGTYMNASQEPVPLLNGELISTEAGFTID